MTILRLQGRTGLPHCSATAALLAGDNVLVATNDGHILLFDRADTPRLRTTVPLTPGHSITSLLSLHDRYAVLSGGRVALFDVTLDEQERLPFKDVSCLAVYKDTLTIATKNTLVVYTYIYDHLEMMAQWKLPEKITCVKTVSSSLTIAASNTNFYTVEHSRDVEGKPSAPTIKQIDWKAGFTIRAQYIDVTPYTDNCILLTRGSGKAVFRIRDRSVTPVTTLPGTICGTLSPFIISYTGSHVHLYDYADLVEWEEVKVDRIQLASQKGNTIIVVGKDDLSLFELLPEDQIVDSIEDIQSAIKILRQMDFDAKHRKLRELEVKFATELFQRGHHQAALKIFTDFCASPIEVMDLYPPSISGKPAADDEPEIDEKAVRSLTHFLTDTRRKLNKLLNEPSHELPYDEGVLTLDIFTGSSDNVEQIQTAIDTTLFKCYTLINPGLIGSLIRVENHCDPQLVVKTLKERNSMSELIDFYFKRSMHTEALDLLLELAQPSNTPDIIVKYLHRLKGDQLPLIINYSNWPISQDEGYGIKIFIDSPYSDTFDRFKVMKFLQSTSTQLERMFLEFIIFELHETAMLFHTRLVELYFDQLDTNTESVQYKKLNSFLQTGRYDNKTVLNMFTQLKSKDTPPVLLLKTITLGRVGRHEAVLGIFVNDIKDPMLAIKYVQDHNTQVLFMYLIGLFQEQDDKTSILHLLSTTTTTTPLFTILELIPQFKVVDLQTYLLKSIRVQHKKHVLKSLQKSLYEVERVAKTEEIGSLEAKKVDIDDETLCEVCMTRIKGSVFVWNGEGSTVRHFGCKVTKQQKLKSMTLKEFNEKGQLL